MGLRTPSHIIKPVNDILLIDLFGLINHHHPNIKRNAYIYHYRNHITTPAH